MNDGSRREFLQFLAEHDAPAYLRRAQGVSEAWLNVRRECQVARDKLLEMPRLRLGVLGKLSSFQWDRVGQLSVNPSTAKQLEDYDNLWNPSLRVAVESTDDEAAWRRSMEELIYSFHRFNQRWAEFAESYDLNAVNELRDGYNKYYVIEKSCAFDSDRLGSQGFTELKMAAPQDILDEFPLLHVPQLRS